MEKNKSAREQFSKVIRRSELTDREFDELESIMREHAGAQSLWPRRVVIGLAASLVLALGVQFWLISLRAGSEPSAQGQASEIAYRISDEVLTNHIHIRQLEFQTGSLDSLAEHFGQLNFRIRPSRYLETDALYLVGGRYCTLAGNIATHLVFESAQGYAVSHYQAAYDPVHFGVLPDIEAEQAPWRVSDRGYQVEIWQEQGLVMAKARPLAVY